MSIHTENLNLHEILLAVVGEMGEETIGQNQLKAILSDLTAGTESSKYMSVVARAVSYGLGRRLLALRDLDDSDFNLRVMNIRHEFMEDNYLQAGVSDYIVDSFIYALGWGPVPDDEAKDGKSPVELPFGFSVGEDSDFIGNINSDGERHGLGIHGKENGDIYAGQWKFNARTGTGMEIAADKRKYAGDFRMNRRHGSGVMTYPDGSKYSGEWKNGKRHGGGMTTFPNGEQMYARYSNDEMTDDNGAYFLQDGSIVCGRMSQYGPDGECVRIGLDGKPRNELWKNGVKLQ